MRDPCKQLVLYFLLAYLISWSCWIPLAWAPHPATNLHGPLYLLGGCGPMASAFLMAACFGGRAVAADLLRRSFRWRVGLRWYVLACLMIPALALLANGATALAGGAWFTPLLGLEMVLVFIFLAAMIPIEEIGRRGFALPRLQCSWSALASSLALGALWACWHLPLFWIEPHRVADSNRLLAFGQFLIGLTGVTVLMTWVFNHTRGSVLVACLMHASMNVSAGGGVSFSISESQRALASWLLTLVIVVFAVGVVACYGPADLAATPRCRWPEEPGSKGSAGRA